MHYAGRLIEFRTLENPTRWMARVAAVLGPLALLTLLLPLSHMADFPMPGQGGRLPEIVLWVGVVTQGLGWWYLLAGASSAHFVLRWVASLLFIAMQVLGFMFATHLAGVTIALTLLFALLTQFGRLRGWIATLSAGLIVVLFFGLLWFSGGPLPFAINIMTQMAYFYLLLLPLIFSSGVDLGETGIFLTRIALWHLHPRISANLLWWIATGIVVLKLVAMRNLYPNDWTLDVALGLLLLGVWAIHRMGAHEEPPEYLVLLCSLLMFIDVSPFADALWSWASVAITLAGAALAVYARGRGRIVATTAVFLLLLGLWNLLSVNGVGYGTPLYVSWFGGITMYTLDEALTVIALAYLLYLRIRGPLLVERIMLILFLVVGYWALLGIWQLLEGLHALTDGAVAAAAIMLLVGMVHDIASGGSLLNHGTPAMPRSARVLMYLGYVLLTAGGTVLANGPSGQLQFRLDTDSIQLWGLVALGIPIFLLQFLHAFNFGHRPEAHMEEAARVPA